MGCSLPTSTDFPCFTCLSELEVLQNSLEGSEIIRISWGPQVVLKANKNGDRKVEVLQKKNVAFNYCNWIWWCFCFSNPFGTWDCLFVWFGKKGWEHSCLEVPSPSPSRSDDFSMQLHVSYPSAQPCELASCLTLVGWMFLAQKPLMLCRRFMSWYTLQGIHISHQTRKGKSSSKWTFSGDMSDMLVPRRVYDDIIMIILLQKYWYSLIHIYLIYSSLLAGS